MGATEVEMYVTANLLATMIFIYGSSGTSKKRVELECHGNSHEKKCHYASNPCECFETVK